MCAFSRYTCSSYNTAIFSLHFVFHQDHPHIAPPGYLDLENTGPALRSKIEPSLWTPHHWASSKGPLYAANAPRPYPLPGRRGNPRVVVVAAG